MQTESSEQSKVIQKMNNRPTLTKNELVVPSYADGLDIFITSEYGEWFRFVVWSSSLTRLGL